VDSGVLSTRRLSDNLMAKIRAVQNAAVARAQQAK
jgi:hypothetical protein